MNPMRFAMSLAIVALAAVLVQAGQEEKKKERQRPNRRPGLLGVVQKVDGNKITLRTGRRRNDPNAERKTVTVEVNDRTKYFIRNQKGRKEAKLSDIVSGKRIAVNVRKKANGEQVVRAIVIREGGRRRRQ